MKLIITIDTEADNQWAKKDKIELKNIQYIPRFQNLCDLYDFKCTYLTSYEMAASEDFVNIVNPFVQEGRAEIGSHLHPWTTPPYDTLTANDMYYHPFPHEFPVEILQKKMISLTELIEKRFKIKPVTFRAGRYGFDGKLAKILTELGYKADCSVTPLVSWQNTTGDPQGTGGKDFSYAPVHPYFPDLDNINNINQQGNAGLLEVPVTILFINPLLANSTFYRDYYLKAQQQYLNKKPAFEYRVFNKLKMNPFWFRPYVRLGVEPLIRVFKQAKKMVLPCVEMIFHSSELMPGGSPYNPDEESIEELYRIFRKLFDYMSAQGTVGITLKQFANDYIQNKNKNSHPLI